MLVVFPENQECCLFEILYWREILFAVKCRRAKVCSCRWLFFLLLCSFDASSWPRFHEPGVPNGAKVLLRLLRDGPVFAFIFSFPHISVSGGVLLQLEKLLRTAAAKRIRADISPCQLWHCYLPESTQSKGGIRERGWWESVCATSSLFTKADHCWRSTWSQLRTTRDSFSCPLPPPLPFPSPCVRSSKCVMRLL